MAYWLIKSEPDVYGIEAMRQENIGIWDGVRNYQARNFLKSMKSGDLVFFYHSNTKPPGIAGLVQVVETMVVDPSQFEVDGEYYDPKSTPEYPRWHTVKVQFLEALPELLELNTLREQFEPEELLLVKRGSRLSVIPIADNVAQRLFKLGGFKHSA
ncbi:EVE domain-containing protein [filamentous cyanobacterium LEGE 11480]|uniref:EVE domain-containing protein n=1 Tax=Romeriopsis navalis LEGE 11480 TaxID=2777977 RepID=A0A928VQU9_9CYAN|nr:EVE domain-containing protein [Romeriopsis navalis]MBE9030862.1 EVE domain-containing protein [Romeriopsis navalis LEGE 11480]